MEKTDEILEIVREIADKMATKVELKEGLDGLEVRLSQRIDSLSNRIDDITDKIGDHEVRIVALEK